MKSLRLVSPLPPSVNNYLNYKVSSNGRRKFVQAYPSEETKIYKSFFTDYVKDQMNEQEWEQPEKGKLVFVKIKFFLDRKRKDPNNFLKVPFDVFTEAGVYLDDDVALPVAERVYIDSQNPRLEFEIYEASNIGVFDGPKDLEDFKDKNCALCKKKPDHCTIFKRIIDNRLVQEFNLSNKECLARR
ncbi:RusA family crossover junction endodeoxyribonuclease [Bacillus sp. FSL M7-1004]|uniref:RusA family crossover junction endodeoxyribonuclease n=1 Tax=Bacillus TaxID=1386 RepID=UPI001B9D5DBC|nr:RusA family crossover junction endodeoxyribonuclease [Bacillus subtilis]MDM5455710.1 RusA family crossover junction endodeoxyribonuclease [Bacillus subtilis]MDW4547561.1 RusA family crossover junction endodeoxyribonuclease [Bacillus subtilis subsp. subtilis]CAF1874788.1 Crossover junction endodeoxyribonuclease RusA [Bacillus subtilis]CAI6330403.1 Crossover junction endodeoxyribonuclease [Bacillus subtilis]